MKKSLISLSLLLSGIAYCQSNDQGTIQLGLGWGVTLGGATIESTTSGKSSPSEKGVGANANYGIRGQYGLAERFSAGIFVRKEGAAYITTDATTANSSTATMSGFGFGLEGKFYAQ